jgi:hypothetical protein
LLVARADCFWIVRHTFGLRGEQRARCFWRREFGSGWGTTLCEFQAGNSTAELFAIWKRYLAAWRIIGLFSTEVPASLGVAEDLAWRKNRQPEVRTCAQRVGVAALKQLAVAKCLDRELHKEVPPSVELRSGRKTGRNFGRSE